MTDTVPYGWVITRDYISDKDETKDTGTAYPKNADVNLIREEGKAFRLLDDDEIVYYHGKILIPEDESITPKVTAWGTEMDDEWEIHPLRWAEGNAGCAIIQYKNENDEWTRWEDL